MIGMLAAQQQADDDRGQGARDAVGGEHREHDRQRQRGKQIACRALQEKDRDKDAADGERRDQGRYRDAGGGL
jgi:hypothetical protein